MASREFLGKGVFGSSYAYAMDNGITIVVKRLKLVRILEQDFKQQVEIVGNIMHENVVPLRAYCSNQDEKLMLYDHYSTGSVFALLHGRTNEIRAHVDWETRLRVAIGAARGISHIHAQNGGKLVHGNLKASNIFLTPQQYGCVSDLGLANMITANFLQTGRYCYAPEVKNTQIISQASDVYSFGILLFELLTRKCPIQVVDGHEAVDLVKLVSSVKSKEWIAKVFDTDLLKNPFINKQMVKMLRIGINCVARSPKKRPKMSQVVKMIEDVSMINIGSSVDVPLERKLVFLENCVPSFDLEDMLSAFAEVLGRGTFGTSYMARLDKGSTIVVKRFSKMNVSQKELQHHVEVIGRTKHENIAELRAYSYMKDEILLVYDYFDKENVSVMLHGREDAGGIYLDWESQLKIAVGAARGIAHIHTLDDSKFVHGNIKTSNIFLNGEKYGCVTDVGLAKLVSPIRFSVMPTPGYCAPEFTDTSKVSKASDVYSFGVVLLELISGKPSELTLVDGKVMPLVWWIQDLTHAEWTLEVFDDKLLRYRMEEGMVQLLHLALDCVVDAPELRPEMADVVKTLHEIIEIDGGIKSTITTRSRTCTYVDTSCRHRTRSFKFR